MVDSTPPPDNQLLRFLVAVEILVLGKILAGVGQLFRLSLGIHVAIDACLFGRLHVFRLAVRGRRANQETAQQNDSGQSNFQMGHSASSPRGSNCSTNPLSLGFRACLSEMSRL